jgi:hypothetical protein
MVNLGYNSYVQGVNSGFFGTPSKLDCSAQQNLFDGQVRYRSWNDL